jgi:hypothetical protein
MTYLLSLIQFLSRAGLIPLFLLFTINTTAQTTLPPIKPRIIITADPELDDNNSLIRLLLYSSDLEIEELIYASSQFHWTGDGKGTKWFVPGREYDRFGMNVCPCESWRWDKDERFIHDIVEAYEKVYPNLKIHNPSYPNPDQLKSKIRYGNIDFDGDYSQDTPGSELIRELILDDKLGPLFITAWGGGSTIARALKSIQDKFEFSTQWTAIRDKINRKVILLPSGDQDDTFATYIRPNWPDIEVSQFSQGPNYGYGAQLRAIPENAPYLTSTWMKENVSDRGPLGELYRVWGDGKQMVKDDKVDYFGFSGYTGEQLKEMGYFVWMPVQEKGSWLGEGDNHTFMNMLGNGLRAFEKGYFGGWGGRELAVRSQGNVGGFDTQGSAEDMAQMFGNRMETQDEFPNFFPQAQLDFAARLQWTVTPNFDDANHAPQVRVEGPLTVRATPGQKVKLHAWTSDPDGDEVTVTWILLPVVTFEGEVTFSQSTGLKTEVSIPETAKSGQQIHVILQATDSGTPTLTSYQRIVIPIR